MIRFHKDTRVVEALDAHPGAAEVFVRLGYRCVDPARNDCCVVIEQDTLEAAARLHGKSLTALLAELIKLSSAEANRQGAENRGEDAQKAPR